MEQDIITQRLNAAFSSAGMTQAELSRLSGIDRGSISLYLNGRYHPKSDKILSLAQALKVSPQWLSGVEDDPVPDTDLHLPIYQGINEAGALTDTGETFAIPHSWLEDEAEQYFLLRISGLAMYPRLLEGDLLLVQRNAPLADNAIAVLVQGGALLVRMVQGSQLLPANPEFPPRLLDASCTVLGRGMRLIRAL
jgi:SOS-response transcriptional repressor LexA